MVLVRLPVSLYVENGFRRKDTPMKSFEYTIKEPVGIHARPAGILVTEAKKYPCNLTLECNGKKADLKRMIAVMSLGVKCDNTVTVTAEGPEEKSVIENLKQYFEEHL